MSSLKILTAALAAATVSLAFAQGTPPRPAADPAVGAGQRSTQNTPMGSTGTPGGGGMAQGGTSAGGAAAATAGSANMGTTGAASSGTSMNAGTSTGAHAGHHTKVAQNTHVHKKAKKKAKHVKADRG